MPASFFVRMRRPKPCFSVMAALGTEYCVNGFPPSASMRAQRAATTGSLGTANGILSSTTRRSALPGTSTPSQKLIVATRTAAPESRKRSSSTCFGASPWTSSGPGTRPCERVADRAHRAVRRAEHERAAAGDRDELGDAIGAGLLEAVLGRLREILGDVERRARREVERRRDDELDGVGARAEAAPREVEARADRRRGRERRARADDARRRDRRASRGGAAPRSTGLAPSDTLRSRCRSTTTPLLKPSAALRERAGDGVVVLPVALLGAGSSAWMRARSARRSPARRASDRDRVVAIVGEREREERLERGVEPAEGLDARRRSSRSCASMRRLSSLGPPRRRGGARATTAPRAAGALPRAEEVLRRVLDAVDEAHRRRVERSSRRRRRDARRARASRGAPSRCARRRSRSRRSRSGAPRRR